MIKTEALYVHTNPIIGGNDKYIAVAVQEFRPGVLAFFSTERGHTIEGKITSDDEGNVRVDRKSTRLNSSHVKRYRMPSSA